jgi:site-specific DNA recombinase
MRSEVRSAVIRAIALGRLWLQELANGKVKDIGEIAVREDRSKRSVHMTMSLAFLAPDIIEAAINGALPRRIGITRLADLPSSCRSSAKCWGYASPPDQDRTRLRSVRTGLRVISTSKPGKI